MITVFRDRWLWVVDKPAGLATQDEGGQDLAALLGRQVPYLGVHHRLDQPASGLVLFTTHESANAAIAAGFREHTIRRTYLAVLDGELDGPVTWAWKVDGKNARTHAVPLGRAGGRTAVELTLETGRKHQIRVHAALAGLPLVGDRRYGGDAGRAWPRLALHAARLTLDHPLAHTDRDGPRSLALTAPLPADLAALWAGSGGP